MADTLKNPFVVFVETFKSEMARHDGKAKAHTRTKEQPFPVNDLEVNFHHALKLLGTMFTDAKGTIGDKVYLETMEVNLGVSADGKLMFLGSGVGISVSTSFKLTFKAVNH